MALLSAPAQYAVRALVYLARQQAAGMSRVHEIAEAEDIPYAFLAKLVRQLVQAGLLDSFKGPTGGVRLALPPHRIKVIHVIDAVDGTGSLEQCFLGLPVCSDAAPCPVHSEWKPVRQRLLVRLGAASISDLAATVAAREEQARKPARARKARRPARSRS